jgi:hypothetical protein
VPWAPPPGRAALAAFFRDNTASSCAAAVCLGSLRWLTDTLVTQLLAQPRADGAERAEACLTLRAGDRPVTEENSTFSVSGGSPWTLSSTSRS